MSPEPRCGDGCIKCLFPLLSQQAWLSISWHLSVRCRESRSDSQCVWLVVVSCDAQVFIIHSSIKWARCQLLLSTVQIAHKWRPDLPFILLFIKGISLIVPLVPHCTHVCISPACAPCVSSLCLSASLLLSVFIPSCPLRLFLWIQYLHIMREWFSWVWPAAQIKMRQCFCLCV